MMRRVSPYLVVVLLTLTVLAARTTLAKDRPTSGRSAPVSGYRRSNGTYVAPHYRSRPDGNFANNWTTRGNVNPYTGKPGTKVVIASHHHADHIGGMDEVVAKYKPKVYVDSGSSHTSTSYKKVLSAVDAAGCQLVQPKKDSERKIELGSVTLRLFPQPPEDENNNSVGIRVEFGKLSVLLTGDSEDDERAWWLKNANSTLYSRVTVMKAAHHGRHNGMNAAWLKAAKSKLVVISCGETTATAIPTKSLCVC